MSATSLSLLDSLSLSLYELQLSESLFSLCPPSSLFVSASGCVGTGTNERSGGCAEWTGTHRPFTRCRPWLISQGWLWLWLWLWRSANIQDSLYNRGADGDCLSQALVGWYFSSSGLATLQSSHLSGSCFWYYHRYNE